MAPRVIPLEEVAATGYYEDMAQLAKIFHHEIVESEEGPNNVWRWKTNTLVDMLHEHAPVYTPSCRDAREQGIMPYTRGSREFNASINLNEMVMRLHSGEFSMEEWMKFYMQIGYSLGGYAEVFGQHEASEYGELCPGAKEREPNDLEDEYVETVIDYMIRVHEGEVLKL
jgi:hypothetical protein